MAGRDRARPVGRRRRPIDRFAQGRSARWCYWSSQGSHRLAHPVLRHRAREANRLKMPKSPETAVDRKKESPDQSGRGSPAFSCLTYFRPCRAGAIGFDKDYTVLGKDGGVERCELAVAHQLFGLQLPRGTTVQRGHRGKPWYLLLP